MVGIQENGLLINVLKNVMKNQDVIDFHLEQQMLMADGDWVVEYQQEVIIMDLLQLQQIDINHMDGDGGIQVIYGEVKYMIEKIQNINQIITKYLNMLVISGIQEDEIYQNIDGEQQDGVKEEMLTPVLGDVEIINTLDYNGGDNAFVEIVMVNIISIRVQVEITIINIDIDGGLIMVVGEIKYIEHQEHQETNGRLVLNMEVYVNYHKEEVANI